eukprot:TRINITY_DN75168_c0_g1_i1.p1 TRINITY_DN75168_c0_g1~~TRINITY_DN75168_c0_g1_i1.p1  ORF type:complete len:272 (+),score=51.19 TRINITY_DN75168_c0_g1_i1:94-909(+)
MNFGTSPKAEAAPTTWKSNWNDSDVLPASSPSPRGRFSVPQQFADDDAGSASPGTPDSSSRPLSPAQTFIRGLKPGAMAGCYSIIDIKKKFHSMDENGDGLLTFDEMFDLLHKGRKDITREDVEVLWKALDHDGDEHVDFDEFVDYIFGEYATDASRVDWRGVRNVFDAIVNSKETRSFTLREFKDMCEHFDLYDTSGFGLTEAEALFARAKRGRSFTFDAFKRAVKSIAATKNIPERTIVNWIASFAPGRANADIADGLTATRATVVLRD